MEQVRPGRQRSEARDKRRSRGPFLGALAELDDAAFRALFRGTPVKRTGRDRFMRNVLIAIGNSGDPGLVPVVRQRLSDASELVRAMAVWALSRLADKVEVAALKARHLPGETDPAVRDEWLAAESSA